MKFEELSIHEDLLEAISFMNFEKLSPIQEKAIPMALQGNDLLACAQTGTGKTASFVIPVLDDLIRNGNKGTTTLIVVPTRELAVQIDQEIQGFSYFTSTTSKSVYGGDKGKDWDEQKRAITEGTNIIVATPGRLMQHLALGYVNFSSVRHLILDEADRMLDMGFYDDIRAILQHIPPKRQTLLFSATMPPNIRKFAHQILQNPETITISLSKPAEGITQTAYMAYPNQKNKILSYIFSQPNDFESVLIFSSTKRNVHEIVRKLSQILKDKTIEAISSDFEQQERNDVLMRFKSHKTNILVATDVLSRGIDIKGINLVINYDVPGDPEDYVHRIGRTARADATGEAITLISDADIPKFRRIEALIEKDVSKKQIPQDIGELPQWNKGHGSQNKNRKNFKKKNSNSNSQYKKKGFKRT
ncbi:MAG: DEAD/DEAH box helicase [Bacteroidales bacterium]|jgi:superfamily II DNA/RNA helicase|nr:DEAD/DEAH box helicase [Bacteroidales bacterium]